MKVFLTGGSGLIGARLCKTLLDRGDSAVVLTRDPDRARGKLPAGCTLVAGDPAVPGDWMKSVDGCDAVVNLAGENLFARRWRAWFKQLIRDSRVLSTQNVVRAIEQSAARPKVLVQGSAVGYYGFHEDQILDEASPPGDDFLGRTCVEWESAAKPVEALGLRLVLFRTGVVMDKEGGALAQMVRPFRWFVGGPVGSGRQYIPWIHWADQVGLILFALDNAAVCGPLNATAPSPQTNYDFSKTLGRVLHRPSFMKAPGFMLRLILGEVADLVRKGQRVVPRKAEALGYKFQFSEAEAALRDILG
jgi:hypothetical protein